MLLQRFIKGEVAQTLQWLEIAKLDGIQVVMIDDVASFETIGFHLKGSITHDELQHAIEHAAKNLFTKVIIHTAKSWDDYFNELFSQSA